jgi:hypothetical protein
LNRTLSSLVGALVLVFGAGDRETLPLEVGDRLVFLGVQCDYSTLGIEEVQRLLSEDLGLKPVGESLRSASNVERRVWALRCKDPDGTFKEIKRTAKKSGLTVERLLLSVVENGREPFNGSTARVVEGLDERIWSGWLGPKGEKMWIFHEAKLTTKLMEKSMNGVKLGATWYHQAFDLTSTAEPAPDLSALETAAAAKLDLLSVTKAEAALALDVYLRSLDSLLILEQQGRTRFCPDIRSKLIDATLPESSGWQLTFSNEGYPFSN